MRKLKVRNRTQVAVVAQALGYGADTQRRHAAVRGSIPGDRIPLY
jgi:hypothetical protein